jgi:hypothetical protein
MMGIDPPLGTPIINQTTIVQPSPQPPNNNFGFGVNNRGANTGGNKAPARPNVPATNAATQQRARKIVDSGDAAFRQQRFGDAYSNYKDAARAAPDVAETYFRQAAAAVALARYDEAVAAIKFGLRLQPASVDAPFRFAALYGPAILTRRQHLDALEQAVGDRPSSDLLFLYGVTLFFDDPQQRSAPLFARSEALAIGPTWHIDLFQAALDRLPADAGPQPVDAAKPVLPAGGPAGKPIDDGIRDI